MRCVNVFYYDGGGIGPRQIVGRVCKTKKEADFSVKMLNFACRTPSHQDGFIIRYRLKSKRKKKI